MVLVFFEDATSEVLGQNYFRDALGVIAADLNGDGLRDLYICDRFMQQTNRKDLLLLRNPITSIRENTSSIPEILIYPNPVFNEFYVETLTAPSHFILENLQGQTIDSLACNQLGPGRYKCSIAHLGLSPAVYVLNIDGIRRKLMVSR